MVIHALPLRERKKLETRERILTAGLDAFAERGFDHCTIDEVARAAGVGKGTVYNYFRTKEDLVVSFMIEVERHSQREASRLARTGGPLALILTRFVEYQLQLKERHYPFVRVFLAQLCGKATPEESWVAEANAALDPPLKELLEALQARGAVRTDVDIDTLAGAFKVMQLGLTVIWALEGPPWAGTSEAIRQQVRLFCSGIEARPHMKSKARK